MNQRISNPGSVSAPLEPPGELFGRQSLTRLGAYALLDWLCIVVLWGAMSWAYWPCMLLLAGRLHALGVLLHDLAHLPLRRKSAAVRALEWLCGYPVASTLEAMRFHHLRHHRDSHTATDPYLRAYETPLDFVLGAVRGLLIVPAWTVRAPFGLVAYYYPAWRNSYARVFLQDRSGKDRTRHYELEECCREEAGQVLFQIGLLGMASLAPAAVFWGYLVPAVTAGLLSQLRLMLEHHGERLEKVDTAGVLRTTRDHSQSWLARLLIGPHNVGYHVAHHLYPQVGFHNLPRLTEFTRHLKADQGQATAHQDIQQVVGAGGQSGA